jgi:hypothetical protein
MNDVAGVGAGPGADGDPAPNRHDDPRQPACGRGPLAGPARARAPGEMGGSLPAVLGSLAFVAVFLVGARLMKHKELEMSWRALGRRRSA